mmetsp:Transcript_15885/g.43329  ORF Transcript_15885/g.43329 Transcript_15885/m.43329 type:complete len:281 (+) Transcript_15885:892-1734(+)
MLVFQRTHLVTTDVNHETHDVPRVIITFLPTNHLAKSAVQVRLLLQSSEPHTRPRRQYLWFPGDLLEFMGLARLPHPRHTLTLVGGYQTVVHGSHCVFSTEALLCSINVERHHVYRVLHPGGLPSRTVARAVHAVTNTFETNAVPILIYPVKTLSSVAADLQTLEAQKSVSMPQNQAVSSKVSSMRRWSVKVRDGGGHRIVSCFKVHQSGPHLFIVERRQIAANTSIPHASMRATIVLRAAPHPLADLGDGSLLVCRGSREAVDQRHTTQSHKRERLGTP